MTVDNILDLPIPMYLTSKLIRVSIIILIDESYRVASSIKFIKNCSLLPVFYGTNLPVTIHHASYISFLWVSKMLAILSIIYPFYYKTFFREGKLIFDLIFLANYWRYSDYAYDFPGKIGSVNMNSSNAGDTWYFLVYK